MTSTISRGDALRSFNHFMCRNYFPARPDQVRRLDREDFLKWIRRAHVPARIREALRTLDARGLTAVLFRDMTRADGRTLDVVFAALSASERPRWWETDLLELVAYTDDEDGPNMQESCQYHRCYGPSPSNQGCVTATQFTEDCPDNECAEDSDCGESSDTSGFDLLQASMMAF